MKFTEDILTRFPGLYVAEGVVSGVSIVKESTALEAFKAKLATDIRSRLAIESVKDDPGFRAYRDFFWSVGIDPTKTRPASEALVRRILSGGTLPRINTAVDAYNLASASSGVPIAAFDANLLDGALTMRFAKDGETFRGIGMKEHIMLKPNQVILTDEKKIIAVYPYRDSDDTKVTEATRDIFLVSCGVPGVTKEKVLGAYEACSAYLTRYSGGSVRCGPLLSP